jgi:hypothetical protein
VHRFLKRRGCRFGCRLHSRELSCSTLNLPAALLKAVFQQTWACELGAMPGEHLSGYRLTVVPVCGPVHGLPGG